jgi:hypothetical protein
VALEALGMAEKVEQMHPIYIPGQKASGFQKLLDFHLDIGHNNVYRASF